MDHSNYRQYVYDGPVEEFGKCIAHRWAGTTYAPSEQKARNNLIFQFNRDNGKLPTSKIVLPGKITVVEGKESA